MNPLVQTRIAPFSKKKMEKLMLFHSDTRDLRKYKNEKNFRHCSGFEYGRP